MKFAFTEDLLTIRAHISKDAAPRPYFRRVKYILILSCILLLSACSSKPTVTVDMQNFTRSDWILVSVRDTSIVVLPTYEEIGKGLAFTHCVVIPSRAISRVILHPNVTFLSRMPLALFGAGVGLALNACTCNDRIYHIVLGFVLGWVAGGLQLFLQATKEDAYFLWLPFDRERLRKEAVFPVEPEIMKYVK
ncbi:MAG: hypothetical protein Q8916_13950 [Bacteroidota bacterium]|nr:hypothetical protein [Bacteroidota bacterium]MDP4231497.1 hypothetical protein [Bacteroidota bacterium]